MGVVMPQCAAVRTHRIGRRDLIGAWLRPNSGVSTDRPCCPQRKGDMQMVTLGADTHKASHTFVAVDDNGRQVAQRSVSATPAGHLEALDWAARWPERRWAIEDCRNLSRGLEAD